MRTVEEYWNYCEQLGMVHINQQKLMSLFKRIYGITIYAFVKKTTHGKSNEPFNK